MQRTTILERATRSLAAIKSNTVVAGLIALKELVGLAALFFAVFLYTFAPADLIVTFEALSLLRSEDTVAASAPKSRLPQVLTIQLHNTSTKPISRLTLRFFGCRSIESAVLRAESDDFSYATKASTSLNDLTLVVPDIPDVAPNSIVTVQLVGEFGGPLTRFQFRVDSSASTLTIRPIYRGSTLSHVIDEYRASLAMILAICALLIGLRRLQRQADHRK